MDEEKTTQPKSETGVTENNYASMLGEAIKQKDAEIAALEASAAKRTKELTDMILNGKSNQEEQVKTEVVKSRKELYEEYQKIPAGTNNLAFWTKFLELRNATIRETGKDPCVTGAFGTGPNGTVQPTYGEAESVAQQMDMIQELVNESNGDAALFQAKYAAKFR